jgi:hypothetical protein
MHDRGFILLGQDDPISVTNEDGARVVCGVSLGYSMGSCAERLAASILRKTLEYRSSGKRASYCRKMAIKILARPLVI